VLAARVRPARLRELRRALPAPVPGQDHHPDARHPRRQGLPGADRGGAAPLVGPAVHRRRVEVPVLPGREPLDPQAGQRRRLVRDGPGLPRPPRAGPGVEAAGVGGLMAETMTPEGFLRLAEDIAREAGDMLVAKRPAMSTRSADIETKSSPTDVVTVLDLASEQLIRERILAARPGDRILGEEEGDRPGETDVRWVADPIDGTVNFLYGLPDWAVSIAVEVRGRIVAGVVNAAARGEVYTASEGGGAWLAGERLRCNPAAPLGQALVATGFGYDAARRVVRRRPVLGGERPGRRLLRAGRQLLGLRGRRADRGRGRGHTRRPGRRAGRRAGDALRGAGALRGAARPSHAAPHGERLLTATAGARSGLRPSVTTSAQRDPMIVR